MAADSEGASVGREDAPERRAPWVRPVAIVLVLAVAAVGIGAAWLYVSSGDATSDWFGDGGEADAEPIEQDLLDASGPHETVLRSLRLAGYEEAIVGEETGAAIVRLDAPYLNTPAHVELAWQTALASAAEAFPDAETYVAQVFSSGVALLEVEVEGAAMQDAIESDDPVALRDHARFTYLQGGDARALPGAIAVLGGGEALEAGESSGARVQDLDLSAAYLDEKNHSAGLLDALGPRDVGDGHAHRAPRPSRGRRTGDRLPRAAARVARGPGRVRRCGRARELRQVSRGRDR